MLFTFEYKMKCKCTHTSSDGSSKRGLRVIFPIFFFCRYRLHKLYWSWERARCQTHARPTRLASNITDVWILFFYSHLATYESHHIYEFVLRRLLLLLLLILMFQHSAQLVKSLSEPNDSDFLWTSSMWTLNNLNTWGRNLEHFDFVDFLHRK